MDLELADKARRCGASRGIGRAIMIALLAKAPVMAIAWRSDLRRSCRYRERAAIVADVATADGATDALERAATALGGIDVAIANVGKSFTRDAHDMDDADLAKSLDMNLWTTARVAQRAIPHLRARGGGSITMISSVWGREAGGAPGYNVAKAAVIALAKAMARVARNIRQLGRAGIDLVPGGGWDRRQADPEQIAQL